MFTFQLWFLSDWKRFTPQRLPQTPRSPYTSIAVASLHPSTTGNIWRELVSIRCDAVYGKRDISSMEKELDAIIARFRGCDPPSGKVPILFGTLKGNHLYLLDAGGCPGRSVYPLGRSCAWQFARSKHFDVLLSRPNLFHRLPGEYSSRLLSPLQDHWLCILWAFRCFCYTIRLNNVNKLCCAGTIWRHWRRPWFAEKDEDRCVCVWLPVLWSAC